jgi:negative regulator of replication initiation
MATRTVRLDAEAERALTSLTKSTGLSISEVLKRGLMAYKQQAQNAPAERAPYELFRRLDLGPGGYARAAAKDAKTSVRAIIARKHSK